MLARKTLMGAAMVTCLAVVVPIQDSRPQDSKNPEIEALKKELEDQKAKAQVLEARTIELEVRVDRDEAWFASAKNAAEMLDQAADEARRNGFESAGANPLARTNVLDGMKGFASELRRGMPASRERR